MKDISIRKMAEDSYPANYQIKIINDIDFAPSYRLDYGSGNYETGVFNKNGQLVTKPGLKYATFKSGETFLQVNYSDMINVGLLSGELYEVTISKLSNTYGWKRVEPSEAPTASDRGAGKGAGQPTKKIELSHSPNTVLHDSSYTYTVNSPTSFSFANNSSGKSGSMNSSQSSWNAAATALNALKTSETTTDAAAPTATGASTPTAPAAAPAAAEAAPAAAAETVDDGKVKDVLKSIFDAVLNKTLKIDISGIDFRAESKVWRGVIRGLGGADGAASKVLAEAGLDDGQKLEIQGVNASNLSSISRKPYLSKIHNYFYGLKKKYVKSFAGITVASEDQIAKAVGKGLGGSAGTVKASERLHTLHTLSKVAARRERAKKSLDSAIEKEASVEDDMTSKVEKRRAAARAKLGL